MMKNFKRKKGGKNKPTNMKEKEKSLKKNTWEEDESYMSDVKEQKWYLAFKEQEEECPQLPKDEVEKLKTEARKFLEQETSLYNRRMSKSSASSEHGWIQTIINKGTVSDRIAAHVVAIQDSPVHTLPLLRNLVGMVKVSKKNECITALDTLTELFLSDILRPDKKLREFEKCPLALLNKYSSGNQGTRKSYLIYWYYEDQLKQLYCTFVNALQAASQDTVDRTKEKAITAMYKLLAGNPEQEATLLKSLLNKLGDPNQKIASKAIYCLTRLLQIHPNMKMVVMEETERLMFRPNVGHRAQYYGICFLGQFLLRSEDDELAKNLITIYFSFFKACVKKGEVNSRLMSALLIGVNRAYPYAKRNMTGMLEHIDTLYRVVHYATFNVSIHTLSLLFQVADFENSVSDRFYSALYKKLLDPQLATSSQQAIFISLVFKALKKDENANRIIVFCKRLLQICGYLPVPLVCGILYLVSQLIYKKENFQALKLVATNAAILDDDNDGSGDEHYEDIRIDDSEDVTYSQNKVTEESKMTFNVSDNVTASIPTWNHRASVKKVIKLDEYDPLQRNPLFAGGQHSAYTELLKLSQHFHPTVSLFANQILQGEAIRYPGDPLQDFSLPRFLDRFVFKNPKKNISEEAAKYSKFSRKKTYMPSGIRSLAVDSSNYLKEVDSRIPVDELFMYRYLKKKMEMKGDNKFDDDDDDDISSVASEEFNEMLDQMMGDKNTELDYAEDVVKSSSNKHQDSDDDDDDDDDDNDAGGNEGEANDDDESMNEQEGSDDEDLGDDEEDIFFDSGSDVDLDGGDDDDDNKELRPNKKKKSIKDKLNKKNNDMYVSAEKFSEMLENMGAVGRKMSGSSALSNKDKAGEKQLNWESARDYWVKKGGKRSSKNHGEKRKWEGKHGARRNERNPKRKRR